MLTQNILTQPTFDLIDWSILSYNPDDKILFCQSNQVFRFDKCKGTIMPRSRILREECQESKYVKNVISATIDAGFVGKLVFKIELNNNNRTERMEENENYGTENQILMYFLNFQKEIKNSVQIDLNPFPNNYYSGTNQTELEPDVIFTSCNSPMEFRSEREKLKEILNDEFYDYSINRIIRDFDFQKPNATRNYWILQDIIKKTYKEEIKGNSPIERNKGNSPIERNKGNSPIERNKGNSPIERNKGNSPKNETALGWFSQKYCNPNNLN